MKTYRIKRAFASILSVLDNQPMNIGRLSHVDVNVIEYPCLEYNPSRNSMLIRLPKNCDSELVYVFLNHIECGKTDRKQVETLKEYFQLAKSKDNDDKIKSGLKGAIKLIFLGLFIILAGSIGGLGLMTLLMSLAPAYASAISLLTTFIVLATAVWGSVDAAWGCLTLGIGILSICFKNKNIGMLPILESKLKKLCEQSPPSYQEAIMNHFLPPVLYPEPPAYQQVVNTTSVLSTNRVTTPPMPVYAMVPLPSHASFFNHPNATPSNRVASNNSPPYNSYYK